MRGLVAREFTEQQRLAYELAREAVEQLPDRIPPLRCHELVRAVKRMLSEFGIDAAVVDGTYGLMDHSWLYLGQGVFLDVYAPAAWPLVQLLFVDSHALPKRYQTKRWRAATDVARALYDVELRNDIDQELVNELAQNLLRAAWRVCAPCDVGEGFDDERIY